MDQIERALLTLVHRAEGKASWHFVATRAPMYDVPPHVNVMKALRDLEARGLLTSIDVGGGMDRWSCTDAGRLVLESPLELAEMIAAAHSDFQTWIRVLIPHVDDGPGTSALLRRVLDADPTAVGRVAFAGTIMAPAERLPFALMLLDDARPAVRAAFFHAWAPPRLDYPGRATVPIPPPELDVLLQRGLTDVAAEVREPAAACVFGAARGAFHITELAALLDAKERTLRWSAILALGTAADDRARRLLEPLTRDADTLIAEAARRALTY